MPAIRISGSSGVILDNVRISGFDVGIEANNSDFTAKNIHFDNVPQPWRVLNSYADVSGTRIRDTSTHIAKGKSQKGWRSTGPALPAHCPRCDTVFASKRYDFGTSQINSRDNKDVCPECRFDQANVADGLFDLTRQAIKVIIGSELTNAMVAALLKAAQAGSEESSSAAEIAAEFASIIPDLGVVTQKLSSKSKTIFAYFCTFLAFSIPLIYAHLSYKESVKANEIAQKALDAQNAPNAIETIMKEVLSQMKQLRFVTEGQLLRDEKELFRQQAPTPLQRQAPAETGSINLPPKSKPKARYQNRRAKAERRRAFNPRHPRSPCK